MDRYVEFFWELIVLVILLRVVLSWRRERFSDLLGRWIYAWTEPVLRFFRVMLDTRRYGFDVSPVLALIFFWLLRWLLIALF